MTGTPSARNMRATELCREFRNRGGPVVSVDVILRLNEDNMMQAKTCCERRAFVFFEAYWRVCVL